MIITRAPLRITFGGGGTDLPSYSDKYGGLCVAAAIDKYVYVAINHSFTKGIKLRYSEEENADSVDDIKHPIIREALKKVGIKDDQLEIVSVADVPSNGAGLGNSGAFTVALLHALYEYSGVESQSTVLAREACNININILKRAQGKQDEYACALGGISCLQFPAITEKEPISFINSTLYLSSKTILNLQKNLMLFYTGLSHSSHDILNHQKQETLKNNNLFIKNLHKLKRLGIRAVEYLETNNLDLFGELLNEQWENKEQRMPNQNTHLSNIHYDLLYNGAIGSKIIGAGEGGFFMVYAKDKEKVRTYMKKTGLEESHFNFDFEGCKRIV